MSTQRPLQGFVDPSFPNPNGTHDAPIIIYGYDFLTSCLSLLKYDSYLPSLTLGILGVALFGISALIHSYQIHRYRTWYFIPVVICAVLEVVGYVFRTLSNRLDPYNVIYFVVQYFMIGSLS